MSTQPATLRLVTAVPQRERQPRRQAEQVIAVTFTPDDRLLLSVPEAAHRIGISRSQLYNLIAAGAIPTVHIGRSCKVRPAALGLAVPGMPIGSPGMDGPDYGNQKDPYDVLLLRADGSAAVFASHNKPAAKG